MISGPPSRLWVFPDSRSKEGTDVLCTANAKLGLAGRYALVQAIEDGLTLKAAAAAFSVSPATAHRWWHRWAEAGEEARRTLSCLVDRSSRPHRSPRQLAPQLEQAICACRRDTGWGPRLVAGATGFCHSTVWKVLKRAGISRPPRAAKQPANRYEWPCPGDLLHMDVSRHARFLRPGHRVTGDRSQSLRGRSVETRVGYDYAHAIVDDHSRLAYVELHSDEKAQTVSGFVQRALAHFAEQGIVAKRLMTDNAWSYIHNRSLRELLARHGIRHLTTRALPAPHQRQGRALPPDDGATSGPTASSTALIDNATRRCHTGSTTTTSDRPHSSLGDRPPISRVHNVCG